MKGTMRGTDIYRQGAATLFDKRPEFVTKRERQLFKEVFFNCLWSYLYQSDEVNLESMKKTVDQFALCIKKGLSLEATKQFVLDNLPEETA